MLVSEILRIKGTTLYTTPPDAPVMDAVRVMAQNDIGSLVVMDHGRMGGIVTFAEVLSALAEREGTLGDLRISAITWMPMNGSIPAKIALSVTCGGETPLR